MVTRCVGAVVRLPDASLPLYYSAPQLLGRLGQRSNICRTEATLIINMEHSFRLSDQVGRWPTGLVDRRYERDISWLTPVVTVD